MSDINVTTPTVRGTKSKLIFAAFKTLGLEAPANDVIDAVKLEGETVTASLVNNIRARLRKKKEERKSVRRLEKAAINGDTVNANLIKSFKTTKTAPAAEADPLAPLFAVKELAAKVGGLQNLKVLVSKLEALAA